MAVLSLFLFIQPVMAYTSPVEIFFNQYTLLIAFVLGIAGVFAKAVGGSQMWLVFGAVLGILILFLALAGLFPSWITIIAIIGASGVFAWAVMKVISG